MTTLRTVYTLNIKIFDFLMVWLHIFSRQSIKIYKRFICGIQNFNFLINLYTIFLIFLHILNFKINFIDYVKTLLNYI